MEEFINESGLEFIDISSEKLRRYYFPQSEYIEIEHPLKLHISDNGHRLWDGYKCYYIPYGWICLEWIVKEGYPQFIINS